MLTDLAFIAGLVAAFVGLALWSLPLALVAGGGIVALLAYRAHDPSRPLASTPDESGGDDE